MTNAIIDNSTLTSVERVLGHIPVNRYYDLSGDLSAFENYLTALLFYDQPVRVDDYQEKFRQQRAANFPELGIVKFEAQSYESLLDQARDATKEIYLKINGGQMEADPIGQFLQSLDLYVSPAWVKQSSDFYLRIRLLADSAETDIEKYSVIMSLIFEQLGENKKVGRPVNWFRRLIGSNGRPVIDQVSERKGDSRKVGGDIKAFSAALNWIALRSVFIP